jgi:hypothetical protein
VHVGDCESDCWEAIQACRDGGAGFAIRACQNRSVLPGHAGQEDEQDKQLLFDLLAGQPALGGKRLWVRGRPGREARWAQLSVSAAAVTLLPPKNWADKPHRRGLPRPAPIRCWAVRVWEADPPQGEEPVEWVILTDEPVTDLASALKVAYWYSCRWLIEEYHKCLKTGCRMEQRQLEEAGRLEALLGVLAVVAVRLLQLKHQAKVNPDAPAESLVPRRYVRAMAAHLKARDKGKDKAKDKARDKARDKGSDPPPTTELTARTFWRETARLGGFLGRKGDGDPGWMTLWRGWERLELLAQGMELARRVT